MNNGQTQNQSDTEHRFYHSTPSVDDPFASAITPGVGLSPEEYNLDASASLNSDNIPITTRENQAGIGSRAMRIDTYLPGNLPEGQVGLAGINVANRANSVEDIKATGPSMQSGAISEVLLDHQNDTSEIAKIPEKDLEQPESHSIIDYGKHFTARDIELVESAIRKSGDDISSLYEKVQNTREGAR